MVRLVSVQLAHVRTVSEQSEHCHCDIGSPHEKICGKVSDPF